MLGFGPKLRHVFASRWKAVTWSLGVLLTAYCTVPSADQVPEQGQAKISKAHPHKSPWSKD